ncbi:MAG: GAP family protein [Solirubrobacterales bacterium]
MGDVFSIFLLSLLAMFNPTLLAAVTIMMLLPDPRKLITGYLFGAWVASIGLGLAIVFSFHQSSGVESSKKTLSPLEDLVFGAILALVGWALISGRVAQIKEGRKRRHEEKHGPKEEKESLPERLLGRGSMRITFAVGALLSLPGASYFVALDKIAKLGWPSVSTALAVIIFCLIQQLLLELPLVGFWLAPERTQRAVVRFRVWIEKNAARAAGYVALTLGCLLIIRGTAYLIFG